MEVGDEILRQREGDAGDEDRRPDLHGAAQPGEGGDEPERHHHREERQLPPHHAAELVQVEAGHRGQRDDGRAERAEGNRRGVGDQRQARGGERPKAQPHQDGGGDRHRRAESGGALEEGAEAKGDEQHLQPAVIADRDDRALQDREVAPLIGELIEKDDVEDDPADGQQAEGRPVHRRKPGHRRRHAVGEDGDGERRG